MGGKLGWWETAIGSGSTSAEIGLPRLRRRSEGNAFEKKRCGLLGASRRRCLGDLADSISLADLAQRQGMTAEVIQQLLPSRLLGRFETGDLEFALADNLYSGYIKARKRSSSGSTITIRRRSQRVLNFRQLNGLSHEMVERLERARPLTFGEARNIPGMTAAALLTLLSA